MKKVFIVLLLSINAFFSAPTFAAALPDKKTAQHVKNTKEVKKNRLSKKNDNAKKDKKDDKKDDEPPEIGNFALAASQQPGPLLSFGQNIIDKYQKQIYLFLDYYHGNNQNFSDVAPSFLYAFSDSSSIYLNAPYAIRYRQEENRSCGIQDVSAQYEYAFYSRSTKNFTQTGTLVANITFPSGSIYKQPPTGAGALSYFLGATLSRMYTDWYFFTSSGLYLATANNNNRDGDRFLYEFGVGRNICYVKSKWIFNWLLEIDGQYAQKNSIDTFIDPNSGGNIITITPSLWFSTKKWIVQFGVGAPLVQHLFGDQLKDRYLWVLSVGYTL